MENKRPTIQWILGVTVIAVIAVLIVVRFDGVREVLSMLWNAVLPLIFGAIFAFLTNLIMTRYEHIWFPNSKRWIVNRTRRGVCLVLALVTITAVIALLVLLIVHEFQSASAAIVSGVSATFTLVSDFILSIPAAEEFLNDSLGSWQDIADTILSSLGGASSTVASLVNVGTNVASTVFDIVLGMIFTLYILLDKERVLRGARRLVNLLPGEWSEYVSHAASVANGCFSRFIFGQCLEATILGTLCALGGLLFGFPYAVPIGVVVGMTSVIPWLGAWIGGAVGAIMILSVNPIQAVQFIIFLIILQQIEGHLIYPNVVGQSVGLPSIWVFAAVVAGGSLFGIVGILLGVPTVSTVRTLWMEYLEDRDVKQAAELALAQEAGSGSDNDAAGGGPEGDNKDVSIGGNAEAISVGASEVYGVSAAEESAAGVACEA